MMKINVKNHADQTSLVFNWKQNHNFEKKKTLVSLYIFFSIINKAHGFWGGGGGEGGRESSTLSSERVGLYCPLQAKGIRSKHFCAGLCELLLLLK